MRLIKEIRSKTGELHFKRWQLLKTPWFCIYIHGIYREDEDDHLHNHPWNLWTMVLWGSYVEKLEKIRKVDGVDKIDVRGSGYKIKSRHPGNMAYRNSEKFHTIAHVNKAAAYTLAIVGKRKKEPWGFMTEKGFVDFKTYRKNKNKRD
jgi:hypothetical protein